jgi:dihydrofolate synthase/folylpolyglutamate synthase
VPLVTGALPKEAAEAIAGVARERSAPHRSARDRVRLERVELDEHGARLEALASPWGRLDLVLPLRGSHQVENAVTALAVLGDLAERHLDLPAAAVAAGFAAARWPGRLEPCPFEPMLWWDAAHNTEGMERLAHAWRVDLALPAPECLIFAVSQDKDAMAMLAALHGFAGQATLVTTRAGNPRARDPQDLAERAKAEGWSRVAFVSGVRDAVELALLNRKHGRVLLAGSIFAIGEAMQALGGAPGEQQ